MKRFWWLLAMPYVVRCIPTHELFCGVEGPMNTVIQMSYSKEEAEDFAAALNEAHERRTKLYWKDSKKAEWEVPYDTTDWNVNNKEACGQDDCGAEPK